MTSTFIRLTAAPLKTQDIAAIARRHALVEVSPEVDALIRASRAVIERHAAENRPVYGLTTALGAAVDTPLSEADLVAYQRRVSFGHSVGFGPALPQEAVRAMMAVRIGGMAAGGTGISPCAAEIRGVADKLGCGADEAYRAVRDRVAPLEEDRELGSDVAGIAAMIGRGDGAGETT
ncbi:aromatic amino acid lyase [Mesorhizobium calcicola]|uniref:Aromatic amino acid lyase n=1 Tax=Mesorhizobium calcicola TaxID=1300310 RepID=A0ABW4WPY4_9HYPH